MPEQDDESIKGESDVPLADLAITVRPRKQLRLLRVRLAPFEAAIAAIVVVQAVVVFGGWGVLDPLSPLLPFWLAMVFNSAYLLSGLAILTGLLWPRGDVEGAGLILLTSVVLARSIMFGQLLGWGPRAITSVAFGGFVALAALARISLLVGGKRDDTK